MISQMPDSNRRRFLKTTLLVCATVPELCSREPDMHFPTTPRERLAVSTYPFRNVIARIHPDDEEERRSGMKLEQFAKTIYPDLGVRGIEPWSRHFESTDRKYVERLKKSFHKASLRVVNIPVDIKVQLCGSAADRTAGLAAYRQWVDAAAILGSPSIRVHLPPGERDGQVSCAVDCLKSLAAYGASRNIVINVENDDPRTEQPERIVTVLKTVDSRYLRALPDFCNSMLIHNDQTYNLDALSRLFPLAYNISHVKDLEQDGQQVYRVDVPQLLELGAKSGYKGFFSMEYEGTSDPYEGTRKLIEICLKHLS